MKLASHYNKASIIISFFVLLVSGIIYYLIINHIARQQLDTDLSEEIEEVVDYIKLNHKLPKTQYEQDQTTFVKTKLTTFNIRFFDAPYKNIKENEFEDGRAAAALVKSNGENYIVTIVESREDTEYLIQIISAITVSLTAVLLVILIITNRYVLNGLWKPFHHILRQVKMFSVADRNKMDIIESKVDEFKELSDAVLKMSSGVISDYQGLKTFTENASHEMMTPLAVITSKLDMLIQDETLRADQYAQINDIYSAANKLARLNQSLLLLVKIDNNLVPDAENVSIQAIIFEKAQQFQELIHNKKIELELSLSNLEVKASRYLMDVLINNLYSNAIRHNNASGKIKIAIAGKTLLFQNTGEQTPLDTAIVFERFYKGKTSEGTGLGLAIMKNICSQYNSELTYQYRDGLHSFEVVFS